MTGAQAISAGAVEGIIQMFHTLTRVLVAFALIAVASFSVHFAWLNIMPMWWWVDYQKLEIIQRPGQVEMVEVWRTVPRRQGIIPVLRFTELHEQTPEGVVIQHCPVVTWTTAEYRTNPRVRFELADFIGPTCRIERLEGRELHLQVTYDVELPYVIRKQESFYLGPFMVRQGELVSFGQEAVEEPVKMALPSSGHPVDNKATVTQELAP